VVQFIVATEEGDVQFFFILKRKAFEGFGEVSWDVCAFKYLWKLNITK
jgi:hypothetical protein